MLRIELSPPKKSERYYFISVCFAFVYLFDCWFVGPDDNSKSIKAITMGFTEVHMTVPE